MSAPSETEQCPVFITMSGPCGSLAKEGAKGEGESEILAVQEW
jgi:hypothetical protein